jgi:hypothetical protein
MNMENEFYGAKAYAQDQINILLNLSATGVEQDWEIELADASRVDEMVDVFEAQAELDMEGKCALALLIISSMEEAHEAGILKNSSVEKMANMLLKNPAVHAKMNFYWMGPAKLVNTDLAKRIFSI